MNSCPDVVLWHPDNWPQITHLTIDRERVCDNLVSEEVAFEYGKLRRHHTLMQDIAGLTGPAAQL